MSAGPLSTPIAAVLRLGAAAWLALASPAVAADTPACHQLAALFDTSDVPVLLASYPAAGPGPLRQSAFVYDNAVAAIALVGCEALPAARRIGEALRLAMQQDRYWHDGRLRNAYAAGPVGSGPVKLSGWWDAASGRWLEDGYQVGSDTGNMAWVMLGWLALSRTAGGRSYEVAAERLGRWLLLTQRAGQGFLGGLYAHEPTPQPQRWRSTEHNADLAAAFGALAARQPDGPWAAAGAAARDFVEAQWAVGCQCFAIGTPAPGEKALSLLALDAQVFPQLALAGAAQRYAAALDSARARLLRHGGMGYSEASAGLWTEGTAQMALVLKLTGHGVEAERMVAAAQRNRADAGGYYATDAPAELTGLARSDDPTQARIYPHQPHLAALAWMALAERGFNPFTASRSLP